MTGIYQIVNEVDNKRYVGSSSNITYRFYRHRYQFRSHTHANGHLQAAWNKHGQESFRFTVIEECPEEVLLNRESAWIEYYRSWDREFGYNLTRNPTKVVHGEETRKKIANSLRGRTASDEAKKHTSEGLIAFYKSPKGLATKQRIAETSRGRTKSAEVRKKIREAQLGKYISAETRKRISTAAAGRPVIMTEDGKDVRFEKSIQAAEYIKNTLSMDKTIKQIRNRIYNTCFKNIKTPAYGRTWRYA
jgi:group I intron endonuclease